MSLYDLVYVPIIICQALLSGAERLTHLTCHHQWDMRAYA